MAYYNASNGGYTSPVVAEFTMKPRSVHIPSMFDITMAGLSTIPEQMLDSGVTGLSMEFTTRSRSSDRSVSSGNVEMNHVLLHAQILPPYHEYIGLRMQMAPNYSGRRQEEGTGRILQPGFLLAWATAQDLTEPRLNRRFEMSLKKPFTLRDFLNVVISKGLDNFDFVEAGTSYDHVRGHRDWVTQFLYQLKKEGMISADMGAGSAVEDPASHQIFMALGKRYVEDRRTNGHNESVPIVKGELAEGTVRGMYVGMQYIV